MPTTEGFGYSPELPFRCSFSVCSQAPYWPHLTSQAGHQTGSFSLLLSRSLWWLIFEPRPFHRCIDCGETKHSPDLCRWKGLLAFKLVQNWSPWWQRDGDLEVRSGVTTSRVLRLCSSEPFRRQTALQAGQWLTSGYELSGSTVVLRGKPWLLATKGRPGTCFYPSQPQSSFYCLNFSSLWCLVLPLPTAASCGCLPLSCHDKWSPGTLTCGWVYLSGP